MQYLLYIDTSTDTGTVAISGDDKLIASVSNNETRNHAATINNMIGQALGDAGITMEELSCVVVCAGPGSYTGLRIGLATAKGICYALDKPLILDNRLTLLCYQAYKRSGGSASQYISLLTARDKEYFISIYDSDFKCTLAPQHIMHAQLDELIEKKENTYFITDVSADIINSINIINTVTDTATNVDLETWALYASEQDKCSNIVNLALAEPFYLKQVYTHK